MATLRVVVAASLVGGMQFDWPILMARGFEVSTWGMGMVAMVVATGLCRVRMERWWEASELTAVGLAAVVLFGALAAWGCTLPWTVDVM